MVVVCASPPALSPDAVSLFYAVDDLLSNSPILIFYGASNTTTASAVNSRIQTHIFSPAGFESYPRLSISPGSALYSAVECLPRDEQGDDICRGLAFSLYKYFSELPQHVKDAWESQSKFAKLPNTPQLFSDAHAAIIASRMIKVENVEEVVRDVGSALGEQSLTWLDLDIVLPPGSILRLEPVSRDSGMSDQDLDFTGLRYGEYAPIIKLFGDSAFIPTARLRRQPSKPTLLNRGTKFTRTQKEILRREMCEVLDTEESYVHKIHELLHQVAEDFREKARNKSEISNSPSQQALEGLFPPSLDQILQVNTSFLEEMQKILQETENNAIRDIETTNEDGSRTADTSLQENDDVTGVRRLATLFLTWFPRFDDCYTNYMQAHSGFSSHLRFFMKDPISSFSRRVHETGEQMLTSMLIEPVQRLPRYNLYIDNIVKQLPARHPAIKSLLKARDIISNICSRDTSSTSQAKVIDHLRRTIHSWPQLCHPQGRLISAIDVVELSAPFRQVAEGYESTPGIFLLFSDALVFLRKPVHSAISARGLMADIDNPSRPDGRPRTPIDLEFRNQLALRDIELTELHGGKVVQMLHRKPNNASSPSDATIRLFSLSGAFDGKAARWIEEIAKARVESRFSEEIRDSHSWEVRCVNTIGDLNLFSAVFEEGKEMRSLMPGKIRITIDAEKGARTVDVGEQGVDIAATLTLLDNGFYRLETMSCSGDYTTRDKVTAGELLPVLAKRLGNSLQIRNQIRNPQMSAILLRHNLIILKSLSIRPAEQDGESSKSRQFKPASPVKLLSNLFGGSIKDKDRSSRPQSLYSTPVTVGTIPRMTPTLTQQRPANDHRPRSHDGLPKAPSTTHLEIRESLPKEEETLASYILALHVRKGNVVGRVVRARANADELQVNELYNTMLEDPQNHQIAAQSSVDVLFAAFEKFLNVAWREKYGQLIPPAILDEIHTKANGGYPGEFEEHFKMVLANMIPQNQTALRALMNLLAELLEATGNDSDRGILTHAFAELLVPNGNPLDFISLLDRFVEDLGALFGDTALAELANPNQGSMNSETRARASNLGSFSSNTSLRKRFGFGSLRETGKGELESKVGAVWRTLSKSNRTGSSESQPSSLSRGSVARSQSIDTAKRPGSRDRPTVLGNIAFEQPNQLSTIGEHVVASPPRKKRRSSLSDLKILQTSASNSPAWNTPVKFDGTPQRATRQMSASPSSPSPAKSNIPTPVAQASLPRTAALRASPNRKENSPASVMPRPLNVKPRASLPKPEDMTATPLYTSKRRAGAITPTGIPSLKLPSAGLSERPTAGNATRFPAPVGEKPGASPSPKRLRMQSPQKLRERMAAEQKAINAASSALQTELDKIGDEIGSMPSITRAPSKLSSGSSTPNSAVSSAAPTGSVGAVSTRLNNVSALVTSQIAGLNQRVAALASDITSSLQVSEARAKKLDELYRDANAENEALYARFNDELARMMKVVRGGDGVEELKRKLKESQEDAERLRRENMRLRREVGGLRAQLKE